MLLINAITITQETVIIALVFVLTERIAITEDNNAANKILINAGDLKQFQYSG
jgi:hypothetical protein